MTDKPTDLVPVEKPTALRRIERYAGERDKRTSGQRIIETWEKGKKKSTVRAYKNDLKVFAAFLEAESETEAVSFLLQDHGRANEIMLDYMEYLKTRPNLKHPEKPLDPATICRYVNSVKSVLKIANLLGLAHWRVDVSPPPAVAYKDTAGPPEEAVAKILDYYETACASEDPVERAIAHRDRSMVLLMLKRGLRRSEVVGLDVSHVDPVGRTVSILGKGRVEREKLGVSTSTAEALGSWIVERTKQFDRSGPLFVSFARGHRGERLWPTGLYYLMKELEERLGLPPLRLHGFRHHAITGVAKKEGVLAAAAFARHKDPKTTMRYIDNLTDIATKAAQNLDDAMDARLQKWRGAQKTDTDQS